jgi:hypothetical protein
LVGALVVDLTRFRESQCLEKLFLFWKKLTGRGTKLFRMWHLFRVFIFSYLYVVLLGVLTSTKPALAHLLPKHNATLHIVKDVAYFVVSVPVSALENVDDDSNGFLSIEELHRNSENIKRQFVKGFEVTDQGSHGTSVILWIYPPHTDGSLDEADYIVVLHALKFSSPPKNLTLKLNLFGKKSSESQITVSARTDHFSEIAVLTPFKSYHQFFRGKLALFLDFLSLGIEHILIGI